MTVARVNFSHGDHDSHRETIKTLRRVAKKRTKSWLFWVTCKAPSCVWAMFGPVVFS
jgi:pyruvate kinase